MSRPVRGEIAGPVMPGHPARPRWVVGVLVVACIAAVTGAAAGWAWHQSRSQPEASLTVVAPTGDAVGAGRHLKLKAKVVDGPLVPGVHRTLRVRMTNGLSHRIEVTRVHVDPQRPPAPGCRARWVRAKDFRAGNHAPLTIRSDSHRVIRLPIRLINLVRVNQDACKDTRFPLALTAQTRPAR